MKYKGDFITNSSSTAYIITNLSNEEKTLMDFAKENIHLFYEFLKTYDWVDIEEESFLKSVAENNLIFKPNEQKWCRFGDEDGTDVGHVYDYILRDGGESINFKWKYDQSIR